MLEGPEATGVRGLASVRASVVGAPTTAGEADTGTSSVAVATFTVDVRYLAGAD